MRKHHTGRMALPQSLFRSPVGIWGMHAHVPRVFFKLPDPELKSCSLPCGTQRHNLHTMLLQSCLPRGHAVSTNRRPLCFPASPVDFAPCLYSSFILSECLSGPSEFTHPAHEVQNCCCPHRPAVGSARALSGRLPRLQPHF